MRNLYSCIIWTNGIWNLCISLLNMCRLTLNHGFGMVMLKYNY